MSSKLLAECPRGLLFILSAPAGTGKTTLMRMLQEEFPEDIVPSVSYTSRKPRPKEKDGVDYHFVDAQQFEELIRKDEFLEHVELYGDYYGTSKQWVEDQLSKGKHVFLVIDTQGAQILRAHINAIFIFIRPPSLEELHNRLQKRKTESLDRIEERVACAKKEIETSHIYDYLITNENLENAYQILRGILIAETHRQ